MKIYLSGAMTGIPNNNAGLFNTAAAHLRAAGHEVTSPVEMDNGAGVDLSRDATPEEYEAYLARDLDIVRQQDAIVFLPGWQHSGGAGREGDRAVMYGLQLYTWHPELPGTLYVLSVDDFYEKSTIERAKVRV